MNIITAIAAQDSPIKSVGGVIDALNRIVGWTYTIFFIAAAFFILVAAYKFLFAQDDIEKIKSAKNQILYAVIAIVIALLSVSFDVIIRNFLGGGGGGQGREQSTTLPDSYWQNVNDSFNREFGGDSSSQSPESSADYARRFREANQ